MVNEFGRSPTKSYSDLLGGMRSVCFGSVCFGSGPLDFFSLSALFWSIRFGFLKLFAPAAWSTHKGTFDCAFLDRERALDRRAEFAPLRPRVDDDCARCLLLVTGLRVGLLPRERERLWEFLSVGPSLEVLALMLSICGYMVLADMWINLHVHPLNFHDVSLISNFFINIYDYANLIICISEH